MEDGEAAIEATVRDMFTQIDDLKRQHDEARLQLELNIESHPLEPQFSQKVHDLMRIEETAGRKGQADRHAKLTQRVDAQMRHECRAALKYIVDLHAKQRRKVYSTLSAERENLAHRLLAHPMLKLGGAGGGGRGSAGRTTLPSLPSAASPAGPEKSEEVAAWAETESKADDPSWADREAGYRKCTAAGWAEGEKFNLTEAFGKQLERIRTEWGEYLVAMEREYVMEKAKLEGVDPEVALANADRARASAAAAAASASGAGSTSNKSSSDKWLSKEKQEQLIHTAPVLSPGKPPAGGRGGFGSSSSSPSRGSASGAGAGSGPYGGSPAMSPSRSLPPHIRRQLQELRQRYEATHKEVIRQRDEAMLWVMRQRNRMLMQVEAVEVERQMQVTHEVKEARLFAKLRSEIQALATAAKKRLTQPASSASTPGSASTGPSPSDGSRRPRHQRGGSFTPDQRPRKLPLHPGRRGASPGSAKERRAAKLPAFQQLTAAGRATGIPV